MNRFAGPASAVAFGVLCLVVGAAVMHFDLPPAGFLGRAFIGGQVWWHGRDAGREAPGGQLSGAAVDAYRPGEAYDGYTLVTTTQGTEALLLDMQGLIVHRWKMSFRRAWPSADGVTDPPPGEHVHWEKCHLFPNGDLLALCCSGLDSPYGYALAKFDKDSNLVWGYSASVHHDFDVAEGGRIYLLTQQSGVKPPPGFEVGTGKFTADYLVVLSPDGKELEVVPVFDAFCNTPFFLTMVGSSGADPKGIPVPVVPPVPGGGPPLAAPAVSPADVLHTNSVRVLAKAVAPKFPMFKAGQVLLSLRTPSTLAVLDVPQRKVVWATRGPWVTQHDAQFLANGHLLLFDNNGSGRGARVVEYDPATQGVVWSCGGTDGVELFAPFRGGNQRLPNGNTLVVDTGRLRLLELTRTKDLVWRWSLPRPAGSDPQKAAEHLSITGAHRFAAAELPFLKAGAEGKHP
jgi:hypothetical protein